jgi:hypothetical protein
MKTACRRAPCGRPLTKESCPVVRYVDRPQPPSLVARPGEVLVFDSSELSAEGEPVVITLEVPQDGRCGECDAVVALSDVSAGEEGALSFGAHFALTSPAPFEPPRVGRVDGVARVAARWRYLEWQWSGRWRLRVAVPSPSPACQLLDSFCETRRGPPPQEPLFGVRTFDLRSGQMLRVPASASLDTYVALPALSWITGASGPLLEQLDGVRVAVWFEVPTRPTYVVTSLGVKTRGLDGDVLPPGDSEMPVPPQVYYLEYRFVGGSPTNAYWELVARLP